MSVKTDKTCEKINGLMTVFVLVCLGGIGGYMLYDHYSRPPAPGSGSKSSSPLQSKQRLPFLKDRMGVDQEEIERQFREVEEQLKSQEPARPTFRQK